MKQELFNGIAKGDLPMLASTMPGGRITADSMAPSDAVRLPYETGMHSALAHAQWVVLFAHLSHTARRCAQADVAGQLKSLGVRRTQTVVISLAREYVHARDLAGALGVTPSVDEVWRTAYAMPLHDHLAKHFRELAQAYLKLLWITAPREGSPLSRWLRERASVHTAQAQAIL